MTAAPQAGQGAATHTIELQDEAQTRHLAQQLAHYCKKGDCLLLEGDLGAGKSSFARAFIQSLYEGMEVVSPTFTLIQTYETPQGETIGHFDLYRLKSAGELREIGLDEALDNSITLIEWPQIAQGHLPLSALRLQIIITGTTQRRITLSGIAQRWHPLFSTLS